MSFRNLRSKYPEGRENLVCNTIQSLLPRITSGINSGRSLAIAAFDFAFRNDRGLYLRAPHPALRATFSQREKGLLFAA